MQEDTLRRVKLSLSEVLALDPSKIDSGARLMDDLGADSLDLVELMFVLERQFGVRLTQDDLRLTRQLGLTEDEIHKDEVLTPVALARLRELFPDSNAVLVEGVNRRQLASLLTVRHLAASIESKLTAPA